MLRTAGAVLATLEPALTGIASGQVRIFYPGEGLATRLAAAEQAAVLRADDVVEMAHTGQLRVLIVDIGVELAAHVRIIRTSQTEQLQAPEGR